MAIEYNLTASPVPSAAEAFDYLAGLLGCDRRFSELSAGRDDLNLTVSMDAAEEDPEMAALLGGVEQMLSATFRQTKNIGDEADAVAFRDILGAAVRFLEEFTEAKGVFTFQFETIYLQRLSDDAIVLDERLRQPDYNRYSELDEILTKYPLRQLDQVLL